MPTVPAFPSYGWLAEGVLVTGTAIMGMDPNAVKAVAAKIRSTANELHELAMRLDDAIRAMDWTGSDAIRFTTQWRDTRGTLERTAGRLQNQAMALDRQADEQSGASMAASVNFTQSRIHDDYRSAIKEYFNNDDSGATNCLIDGIHAATPGQGNGIVVTRLFIRTHTVFMLGKGDERDFSKDPDTGYRLAIAWNTETGEMVAVAQPSHVRLPRVYPRIHLSNPLEKFPDIEPPSLRGDWKEYDARPINCGHGTYVHVLDSSSDGKNATVAVDYHATLNGPSLSQAAPSIDGTLRLEVNDGHVTVTSDRDNFPSLEVIQYRPGEKSRFLARAEEGNPHDLTGTQPAERAKWIDGKPVDGS